MEIAGYVVLGAGFVAMALGMFEIVGLFAIGVGLVAVLAGCLLVFARGAETGTDEEEVFARQLRDL
jgi:hypothetical protein